MDTCSLGIREVHTTAQIHSSKHFRVANMMLCIAASKEQL